MVTLTDLSSMTSTSSNLENTFENVVHSVPSVMCYSYLQVWRDVYLLTVTVLFGAVLLCQTTPRYHSAQWFYRRVLLYMGLVAYGVVPTVHWVFLSGGLRAAMVQVMTVYLLTVYFWQAWNIGGNVLSKLIADFVVLLSQRSIFFRILAINST